MNYKERGYLFQDIFSTYIIIKYVKQILCGQKVQTEVVLDKKNSKDDKFDDLKIINNDDILEVQLKYKEIKEELELSDFSNYSGDFNLYQFIRSYKNGKNKQVCLLISLNKIKLSNELIKVLILEDDNKFFSNSHRYKFKKTKQLINILYKKRLSAKENPKIDYSDLTKNDIEIFLDNFVIEITNKSIANNSIKVEVLDEISDDIEKISKIPKQVLYNDMIETIREYRAEDEYRKISISEITKKWIERIKLMNYTIPVNNELNVDYDCFISRRNDIKDILEKFNNTNLIHVIGQPGVGKSWFSKELTDELCKKNIKNSTYYFYFNYEDVDKEKRLNEYNFITTFNYNLQKFHGYNINIFNMNFEKLVLGDDGEEHYIIFDGLDHIIREKSSNSINIGNLIEKIVEFSKNNKNVKVLILSQPLEEIKIESIYELKNLNEHQSNKLIELYSKTLDFPLEKLIDKRFYYNSCGNPLLLKYMVTDYILNGNLVDYKITDLNDYYKNIFDGKQFVIYMYFAILSFPISSKELEEISSISLEEIIKELKCIRNVLLINEKNEYTIFHESLRRYILSLKQLNKDKLIMDIINWFNTKDLYFESKKFNYYPSFVLENKKYELFDEKFNYQKIKMAIIQNAYSNKEVHLFIRNLYMISQNKLDFKMLYYLEYFYDTYYTFSYDFDVNIFENYIYMLYYSGEFDLIRKLIYTKNISEFSNIDEQWEYMRKILVFLLKNKFELNYKEIINKYFNHDKSNKVIRINDLLISDDYDNIRLIYEYLKYNKISDLKLTENNLDTSSDLYVLLNALLKNEKSLFIECFYKKDIFILKNKNKDLSNLLLKLCEKKYISSLNNLFLLINYIFNNNEEKINKFFSNWNQTFENVPCVYKFICIFIKLLLNDNPTETEIADFFDQYNFETLNFEGYLSNYNNDDINFIGKLVVLSSKKNFVIQCFMKFKERISKEATKHYHDGIISLLASIYSQIIENVKYNNIILNKDTLNEILIRNNYQQSNITEFENNIINYTLSIISGEFNDIYYNNIIKYMFSYGSYRDIQIWELEDILSRLIDSSKIDLNKFIQLVTIAYNAIDRMDRAKDVWHVPNELIKMYSDKISPIEAINVFFSFLETFDYDIRDKDDLFSHLYENLSNNEKNNKINFIYNYWRFMNKNITYQFDSNNTELKKCIKNSTKSQFNFLKYNILESLKLNDIELNYNILKEKFKKKKLILNYTYHPIKNYLKNDNPYTNSIKFNSFAEFIEKINNSYFDCRTINFDSFIKNIKELNDSQDVFNLFINIKNSSYLNYIYEIFEKNNLDYNTINEDIIVEILVGIYYRSNGYVSNMSYDEIFEKALQISPTKAKESLKRYVINDNNIDLGRKSGKIFKYLLNDNDIDEIYNYVIEIYFSRLPNYIEITRYWNLTKFDNNDILLNYFLIKIMNSGLKHNPSTTEEMIFLKLFEVKKFSNNKIVYMKNMEGDSLFYIINFLKMYSRVLRINYDSFLNYKNINKFNYIKFQINNSKTEIVESERSLVNDELDTELVRNYRGLIAIESDLVYWYEANMYQDFGDDLLDRNINYKIFHMHKVNVLKYLKNRFLCNLKLKIYWKKINKIIRKSYYVFPSSSVIYIYNERDNI